MCEDRCTLLTLSMTGWAARAQERAGTNQLKTFFDHVGAEFLARQLDDALGNDVDDIMLLLMIIA